MWHSTSRSCPRRSPRFGSISETTSSSTSRRVIQRLLLARSSRSRTTMTTPGHVPRRRGCVTIPIAGPQMLRGTCRSSTEERFRRKRSSPTDPDPHVRSFAPVPVLRLLPDPLSGGKRTPERLSPRLCAPLLDRGRRSADALLALGTGRRNSRLPATGGLSGWLDSVSRRNRSRSKGAGRPRIDRRGVASYGPDPRRPRSTRFFSLARRPWQHLPPVRSGRGDPKLLERGLRPERRRAGSVARRSTTDLLSVPPVCSSEHANLAQAAVEQRPGSHAVSPLAG